MRVSTPITIASLVRKPFDIFPNFLKPSRSRCEINFGNQQISWTGLGSLASGGYTFYWKRTDIDAEWSERECTTNSIYLQCVPGASYAWKVKAYGACDEKESAIFIFTV